MPEFVGYDNLTQISRGRDRIIYSAMRVSDRTPVILKALTSEHPSTDLIALMYHEYEVTKDLDLAGIIKTYELIDQKNCYALVQEDIRGVSLSDYLKQNPIRDLSVFFQIAIPMTQILGELHQHYIIHKDIKPSNFIINPETLEIKVTDFNFSTKLLHEVQDIVPPEQFEGTLAYMAPEQTGRMNMNIDYRSDFYALGVSFYEMLTGELPYIYSDPLELLHAHLAGTAPRMRNLLFDIPDTLSDIVNKLMAKDPGERYQSAAGLEADLVQCQKLYENTGQINVFPLGKNDISDRLNVSQKLYGREEEAKYLISIYERISHGAVEALMVYGYSGIGKTKLINEVHKHMVRDKGFFVQGKFDQLQRDKPYIAITQAFNQLVRLILAEPEDRYKKFKDAILEALGSVGQVMVDLAPDLQLIVGTQPTLELLSPKDSKNRLEECFKRFMRAIVNQGHPLIIFLDDLQWIDSSSINLLEFMMTDDELGHLLLLGAYRNNEINMSHPLQKFIEDMEVKRRHINLLELHPLAPADFIKLFEDTLNRDAASVKSLAELIHQRTDGNPFFCKQVLNLLYKDKLLYFNHQLHCWDWDLDKILSLKITENVVDMMISKLSGLPDETQNLLKHSACIGNRFSVELLMLISGKQAHEVGEILWPALQEDLLITSGFGYKRMEAMRDIKLASGLSKEIHYQFIHDRVQQTIYNSINDKNKQEIHLAIARILLKKESGEISKYENLFEIADHFNQSHSLLVKDEMLQVANLNFCAAERAKNSSAYKQMYNYLTAAKQLVNEESWHDDYDLTFKIERNYLLSLYLTNKFDDAVKLCNDLLALAHSDLDKVSVYRILIMKYIAQEDVARALETARTAMSLLGIELVLEPSVMQVMMSFFRLKWKMRKFSKQLMQGGWNNLTDAAIESVFEILVEMWLIIYEKGTNTFFYTVLLAMQLQIEYGRPRSSGLWVTAYAIAVLNITSNINEAFMDWSIAKELFAEFPDKYSSGIAFIWAAQNMVHLKAPVQECLPDIERGLQDCREAGNTHTFIIGFSIYCFGLISAPKSLNKATESLAKVFKLFAEHGYLSASLLWELIYFIFVDLSIGMRDESERFVILEKSIIDSSSLLSKVTGQKFLSFYYFFNDDYDKAIHYHFEWYQHEDRIRYELFTIEVQTLNAIAIAKMIPFVTGETKQKYQKRLKQIASYVRWAAHACPANYLHHLLFITSTQKMLENNVNEALISLNLAIENAKKNDFHLWIALGNELSATCFIEQKQMGVAVNYLREAHYYYKLYGLVKKVKSIEERYPQIFESHEIDYKATRSSHSGLRVSASGGRPSGGSASNTLDFMSVIKASQTISSEILLNSLFQKMLHIVIENAGAQYAVFLEVKDSQLVVTASIDTQQSKEDFHIINTPLKEYQRIPASVIQFVIRSRQSVVLANAAEDENYRSDQYIRQNKIKSILCLPVMKQDDVLGVIYLENNLTIGAFTQDRVTVLSTLASQIAISLQNSHYVDYMQQLYLKAERFVPKQFLNILQKKTIQEVELGDTVKIDLTAMFADIRNFTNLSEQLNPEHVALLLNTYLGYMTPIITRHHGFVAHFLGDGILALFTRASDDAVKAALEMQIALSALNEDIKLKGFQPIKTGIGLNYGPAMLSILGAEERIDANVISDAINTASRIEGLNKYYNTHLLISEPVYQHLNNPNQYLIRTLGRVRVKGKSQSMRVYEVALKPVENDLLVTEAYYIRQFESGLSAYEQARFSEAISILNSCLDQKPNDAVATQLLLRAKEFEKTGVPKDWTGDISMSEK